MLLSIHILFRSFKSAYFSFRISHICLSTNQQATANIYTPLEHDGPKQVNKKRKKQHLSNNSNQASNSSS